MSWKYRREKMFTPKQKDRQSYSGYSSDRRSMIVN